MLDLFGEETATKGNLRYKFVEPPLSVLDTKTKSWMTRKQAWKNIGIKSEIGRSADTFVGGIERLGGNLGMSIFDPALCELMYRWYCPDGGTILDPFAGGSVRGVVAHTMGYYYTGIDLREEQIIANRENALEILGVNNQPNWYCGDSDLALDMLSDKEYDMIFSCPPYMDLEVYSDDVNDLSNMSDCDFETKYKSIIKKTCEKLKNGSFAVFVVGDVRDKKTGFYKNFVSKTINAFLSCGMGLYNECILLDPLGSAPSRCGFLFERTKKLTKVHQNVLIFKKPEA